MIIQRFMPFPFKCCVPSRPLLPSLPSPSPLPPLPPLPRPLSLFRPPGSTWWSDYSWCRASWTSRARSRPSSSERYAERPYALSHSPGLSLSHSPSRSLCSPCTACTLLALHPSSVLLARVLLRMRCSVAWRRGSAEVRWHHADSAFLAEEHPACWLLVF